MESNLSMLFYFMYIELTILDFIYLKHNSEYDICNSVIPYILDIIAFINKMVSYLI